MKKRPAFPSWAEAIIPTLPLLMGLVSWQKGLHLAFSGAIIFLVLAFAAKFLSVVLKKQQLCFLYFLAASVCVYSINAWRDLPAILILSICLLGPSAENKDKYNPALPLLFLKAGVFFLLAVYLSAAQEVLGGFFHLSSFQRVSGSFLLLVIPALFWPASRKLKGKVRRGPALAEALA